MPGKYSTTVPADLFHCAFSCFQAPKLKKLLLSLKINETSISTNTPVDHDCNPSYARGIDRRISVCS
jgi:hypothetical protein